MFLYYTHFLFFHKRKLKTNFYEQVSYSSDGLEAVVFTAQGDMRQALNNLQSTWNGFRHVDSANVFKVCDEPHPLLVKEMLLECVDQNISKAYKVCQQYENEIIEIIFMFLIILLFFFADNGPFVETGLCP